MYTFNDLLSKIIEIPKIKIQWSQRIIEQLEDSRMRLILLEYQNQINSNLIRFGEVYDELKSSNQESIQMHLYSRLMSTITQHICDLNLLKEEKSRRLIMSNLIQNEQKTLACLIMARNILTENSRPLNNRYTYALDYLIAQKEIQISKLEEEKIYDIKDILLKAIEGIQIKREIYEVIKDRATFKANVVLAKKIIQSYQRCQDHYREIIKTAPVDLLEGMSETIFLKYRNQIRGLIEEKTKKLFEIRAEVELQMDLCEMCLLLESFEKQSLTLLKEIQGEVKYSFEKTYSMAYYILKEIIEAKENLILEFAKEGYCEKKIG